MFRRHLLLNSIYRRLSVVVVVVLFVFVCFGFGFLRQDFAVALEPVLELVLVDQASLKLTEICLPLPPECWD